MSLVVVMVLAAVALVAAMTCAWVVQRATGNAGWVDVVWSAATGCGAAAGALVPVSGVSIGGRQILVAGLAAFWSARLAWHIARRTFGAEEDVRYAAFRREWGGHFQAKLFWLLMIQAAAAWVLVLSVVMAARNPAGFVRAQDVAGAALLAACVQGEATADMQLQRFRRQHSGGICDAGLWGWSRHPNYFFEFLGWCAYPVIAIDASGTYRQGLLALLGPALMFWLLRYVSGVPPLEKLMLERRGAAFRAYQARVSAFVPLPPSRPA